MRSPRPRTVLLTADTVGGVWSHVLELARALGRDGIGVVLAAMGRRPTDEQSRTARAISNVTLHAAPYRLPWMDQPWDDVARAGEWLLALADAFACDLVHLSEPVFAALPWRVPTLAVGHSCVLSWYEAVRGEEAPEAWARYRRAMVAGLHAADAVVAPSATMAAALRRHYGVRESTVIRNGRSAGRYVPARKEPVVFTAGRLWDPAKNLAALVAAAPHLPWPMRAAGEARSPEGKSAAETGAIALLGRLDEDAMAGELARAAIFALPARYEPFGQSILEAALAGCALVLGDIPSLRELWDGVAVFAPPEEPEALRSALDSLIRDGLRRHRLGMAARCRGLEYSPERMADGYVELYARLLQAAPGSSRRREASACAW
jgi:glycogen(starch) synthase